MGCNSPLATLAHTPPPPPPRLLYLLRPPPLSARPRPPLPAPPSRTTELLSSHRLGPAADVYAFAIMMWELSTCSTPFPGMTVPQIIYCKTLGQVRDGVGRKDTMKPN